MCEHLVFRAKVVNPLKPFDFLEVLEVLFIPLDVGYGLLLLDDTISIRQRVSQVEISNAGLPDRLSGEHKRLVLFFH